MDEVTDRAIHQSQRDMSERETDQLWPLCKPCFFSRSKIEIFSVSKNAASLGYVPNPKAREMKLSANIILVETKLAVRSVSRQWGGGPLLTGVTALDVQLAGLRYANKGLPRCMTMVSLLLSLVFYINCEFTKIRLLPVGGGVSTIKSIF